MVYFRCERCAGVVRGQDRDAGQALPCPKCGHQGICPARGPSSQTAPTSADSRSTESRPSQRLVALAGILALTSVAWGAWSMLQATSADVETPPVTLSPVEARQRKILRQAIDRPADPDLSRFFDDINTHHFAGRLPRVPVAWEPALGDIGPLVNHAFTLEGMFGLQGDKAMILLHPHLASDRAALRRALVHEMVHAYLHTVGASTTSHGERFQTELKRLSQEGAFEGVVADETERASLRSWLDSESSRIATDSEISQREARELEQERMALERDMAGANGARDQVTIDSLNARREAYNRRVEAAALHAERGRADLVELNRQIQRYNLMLVYPDGMDHERVEAQTARGPMP